MADSMADSESDLETDGLELALETLHKRHCTEESTLRSKSYCSEFCEVSLPVETTLPLGRCLQLRLAALLHVSCHISCVYEGAHVAQTAAWLIGNAFGSVEEWEIHSYRGSIVYFELPGATLPF